MSASPNQVTKSSQESVNEWLQQLDALVQMIAGWATRLGWSTRRIDKQMRDASVGSYSAPALVLQRDTTRVLMEPIARSAPGAEGVVDLYLMPAYDDIASLYLVDGTWQLHYMYPGTPTVATIREANPQVLTQETLEAVLAEMTKNVA